MTLKPTTFRLETEIMVALAEIRDRDGMAVSEQVRRALKQWIEAKGVKLKTDRKRARTRKRP
ncbi:MAG TPA: hypothetical protein VG222_02090 [Vicinamibacterales bacterium]|nr:hypothetical protein [Vicinamibacterales bacterium]